MHRSPHAVGASVIADASRRRLIAALMAATVATMLLSGAATAQSGSSLSANEPPRRHTVLPGLESYVLPVDPDVEWYDRAIAGRDRAYRSAVIVQNAQHPDWPPLSGYVIGERFVITAHLDELQPGEVPPRFLVRTVDGTILEGEQVAGWERWDFGVIGFNEPLGVPPIEFADPATVAPGDLLLNIASPNAIGRTGLLTVSVGTFLEYRDGYFRGDISTAAGGSGSPIVDLDGRLVGMSSFGIDIPVVPIDRMQVADLAIRSAVPIDRGGGEAGAGVAAIASLTEEYRR